MTLLDYLNSSKKSLFRLECLQNYDIGVDDMSDEEMLPWWDFIKNKTQKEEVIMQRVRVVKYPPTDYVSKELEVHKKSVTCGDDIRIIDSELCKVVCGNVKDFWLIDDVVCLEMVYGVNGEWLGFELSQESQKYIEIKEVLLKNSTKLT